MKNFEYFWYKNRKWFIAAAVIIVGAAVLIAFITSDIRKNNTTNEIGTEISPTAGAAIITPSNEWVGPSNELTPTEAGTGKDEKLVIARVEDGVNIYEAVLSKMSGRLTVYENGVDTGKDCRLVNYSVSKEFKSIGNVGILSAENKEAFKNWFNGDKERVMLLNGKGADTDEGETSLEILKGILNLLIEKECSVMRKVLTQDYVDIYVETIDKDILRIAEYENKIYIAKYSGTVLPEVISYFE